MKFKRDNYYRKTGEFGELKKNHKRKSCKVEIDPNRKIRPVRINPYRKLDRVEIVTIEN